MQYLYNDSQDKPQAQMRFQVLPAVQQLLGANVSPIAWFRTNVPRTRHTLSTAIGSVLAATLCQKFNLNFVDNLMISI